MKKIIPILLIIAIIFSQTIFAVASDSAIVSAEDMVISKGETILVPVNITNNPGIMGFKITVGYSENVLEITSVTRGNLTPKGNFNDSLGKSKGEFSVVWNATENIKRNGSLFVIGLRAKDSLLGSTRISLSFSQEDTFNEAYKDVVLECKDFNVLLDDGDLQQALKNESSSNKSKPNSTAENTQVITAVKVALNNYGYKKISDVQTADKEDFVTAVNANIKTITNSDDNKFENFDEVKKTYIKSYQDSVIKGISENVDEDTINVATENALHKVSASSINKITEDKKAEFIEEFLNGIYDEYDDIPEIASDLDTDDALFVVKKLSNSNISKLIIVLIVISLSAILFTLIILFTKRRNGEKK